MDHFSYRAGRLHAEDVAIADIIGAVGTPAYLYSTATLERHYRVFHRALSKHDPMVCFAVKANGNLAVIRTLADLGSGADVVSAGELRMALHVGIPADRIIFSGVGKQKDELSVALAAGVGQINVESEPELLSLDAIARGCGLRAPVAIRINPDVDARTHEKISTGRRENKFGIEWTDAHRVCNLAASLPGIGFQGIAVHIGSRVTDTAPFRDAFLRVRDLVMMLRADGLAVRTLDLGGGLGAPYGNEQGIIPPPDAYAAVIDETVGHLGCQLIFEPGRVLVANAGILVTRVIYVKEGATRTFVIVDAGMNDLMRPALYGAFHEIVPEREAAAGEAMIDADIVGPICETSDTFAVARTLPRVAPGDLLALRSAGAYGAVMASSYNARPLVAEAMVHGSEFAVVSVRGSIDDLLSRQHLAPWQHEGWASSTESG